MKMKSDEKKNVLVFNCGSSSLKYRLIEFPTERELAGGEAQRVGPKTTEPPRIIHRVNKQEEIHNFEMPDHGTAFQHVMDLLARDKRLIPHILGHRIVHGGSRFSDPAVVNDSVMTDLEAVLDLAPIHNPPAIGLVNAIRQRNPEIPQVAVFDTAFHSTIPDYAYTYALPRKLNEDFHFRKYGFHGISHQYVCQEAARFLNIPPAEFNAVSCHLGSGGASLCAVVNGRSVDNTMGFSPLQGLIMSTRCGDLDPALTLRLLDYSDNSHESVEALLNKKSGVLGMTGMSADIRDVLQRIAKDGDYDTLLSMTMQVYLWRIRKYLGSYLAVSGSPQAVIFTDTIGELVPFIRWAVCTNLEAFGVKIDPEKNQNVETYPTDVSTPDSPVKILIVQTNEELAIARYAYARMLQ